MLRAYGIDDESALGGRKRQRDVKECRVVASILERCKTVKIERVKYVLNNVACGQILNQNQDEMMTRWVEVTVLDQDPVSIRERVCVSRMRRG